MPISRERAVDLSHRLLERLKKTPALSLGFEDEQVRNRALKAIVDWDKENEKLSVEAKKKISLRGRRVVEGSREWDLAFAEEMERAYAALLSRGE